MQLFYFFAGPNLFGEVASEGNDHKKIITQSVTKINIARLQTAFLSEHRDESVGMSVPDLVILFEPRDLIHVRRIEHIGLQQTHPVLDRMAVLLFNRREIACGSLDFLGHVRS